MENMFFSQFLQPLKSVRYCKIANKHAYDVINEYTCNTEHKEMEDIFI